MELNREHIVEIFTEGQDEKSERIRIGILGALISSYNNTCRAEREHNLDLLCQIRDALADVQDAECYFKFCCRGIEILQKELQEPEKK